MTKKTKISKNLTDGDMLASYLANNKEEPVMWDLNDNDIAKPTNKPVGKELPKESDSFFKPELQEKVNKALLELKIKLFNEGIVDYDIKVTLEGKQVLLTAVPLQGKRKNMTR